MAETAEMGLETVVCVSSSHYNMYDRDLVELSWLRVENIDRSQLTPRVPLPKATMPYYQSPTPITTVPSTFVVGGWAEKPETPLYSHNDWGYISPSNVLAFKPKGATVEIEGAPTLKIYYGVRSSFGLTDGFYVYRTEEDDFIFNSYIPKGQEIDPDFVVEDWTGKYIPITRETVDGVLAKAAKEAEEGNWPHSIVEQAQIMGSNIGYMVDIDAKLKDLRPVYERGQIRKFQENIREEIKALHGACFYDGWPFVTMERLCEDTLGKQFDHVLKFLPQVVVPADLREDLLHVLGIYREVAYTEAIEETRQEIREGAASIKSLIQERKDLDEMMSSLRQSEKPKPI